MRNLPQLHFCLLKQLSSISTNLPCSPTNHHKKNCKEQLKIEFDIALQQNCDQSARVWWSTQRVLNDIGGSEKGALL
jgi:hypothetical protein